LPSQLIAAQHHCERDHNPYRGNPASLFLHSKPKSRSHPPIIAASLVIGNTAKAEIFPERRVLVNAPSPQMIWRLDFLAFPNRYILKTGSGSAKEKRLKSIMYLGTRG
jgi:hypothetical protein